MGKLGARRLARTWLLLTAVVVAGWWCAPSTERTSHGQDGGGLPSGGLPSSGLSSAGARGGSSTAVRYSGGRLEQIAGEGTGERPRQIVVRLPQARDTGAGEVLVEPNLDVLENSTWVGNTSLLRAAMWDGDGSGAYVEPPEGLPAPRLAPGYGPEGGFEGGPEVLPFPEGYQPGSPVTPIFEEAVDEWPGGGGRYWWGLVRARPCNMTSGVGRERLPFAPFEIEGSQPFTNFRIRTAHTFNRPFPDRAGYYWAKGGATGTGPKLPERSVDSTQLRFLSESGGDSFSLGFEVPFSWVDPEVNRNHTGLSDLLLQTKTVMVDGDEWQITQFFRTQFNTGSQTMGLGTGRIALEPGFLFRYRWSDITYFYGDIRYWVPMGGDPVHSGQVLTTGLGVGHLLWESDKLAVIPTFELLNYAILNGQMTTPLGLQVPTDGAHVLNLVPGVRIARDGGSDLGLFEFGVSGGWALTGAKLYESILRIDVRFSY